MKILEILENLKMLEAMAETINKDLPTTIDLITIWERTSINTNKRMITYHYKIDTAGLEQFYDYQAIQEVMKIAVKIKKKWLNFTLSSYSYFYALSLESFKYCPFICTPITQ